MKSLFYIFQIQSTCNFSVCFIFCFPSTPACFWRLYWNTTQKCKVIRKICIALIYLLVFKPGFTLPCLSCLPFTDTHSIQGIWIIRTAENQVDYFRLNACITLYQLKMLSMSACIYTELFLDICKVILAVYQVMSLGQLLLWFLTQILGHLLLLNHSQPSKRRCLRKADPQVCWFLYHPLLLFSNYCSSNFSVWTLLLIFNISPDGKLRCYFLGKE